MKSRLLLTAAILFCAFTMLPSSTLGDTAEYLYDDVGRLSRVVKGAEGLIYQYDQVGNLLSINGGPISQASPVILSINPDVLFIGAATLVTISGQNLFATKDVTANSSALRIRVLDITETEIKTEITVSTEAVPGTADITVVTLYGSASTPISLIPSKLAFNPENMVLTPGAAGSITASITPSIGRELNISVRSNDPSVISVPQFVSVPAEGSAVFAFNTLKEGYAIISSGDARAFVFVTAPFQTEPGEDVTRAAGPVSVYIATPAADEATSVALPVGVYIEAPTEGEAPVNTLPVSAKIPQVYADAISASLPVSSRIDAPGGYVTALDGPVSVYMEQPPGSSTLATQPVSAQISP